MRPLALCLTLLFALACSESVSEPEPTIPTEEEDGDSPPPPDDPPEGSARLADPALSTFAVSWGPLFEVTQATIQLRDASGNPVDTVASWPTVGVRGANAGRQVTLNQLSTGLFQALYVPADVGFDTLVFSLDGVSLGDGEASDLVRHFHVRAARGAPTLDGVMTPGEWPESAAAEVSAQGADPVRVYAVNDDDNVYIAVVVPALSLTWANGLRVRFDGRNDAVLDHGEQAVRVSQGGLVDMHYDTLSADDRTEPQSHGSGMAGNDGQVTVFEFAQPLSTGDALDFSVSPGGAFGVCLRYYHSSGSTEYPTACMDVAEQQRHYGEIQLAN